LEDPYFRQPAFLCSVFAQAICGSEADLVMPGRSAELHLSCLCPSVLAIDSFLVWSVFLILGIAGFSRLHLSDSRWAYTGTQGGLAFITALVTGNGPPDTIDPIVNRICGITIGVLIFMGIVFIVRLSQTRMQATRQGI
jgi:hypothetical protein